MAIRGSLREASLPDVLQLLAMGKKTGCLSVTHRQHFGTIFFNKGRIAYASIVNRRDRLGDMLVNNGLIGREDLERAIALQVADPARRIGEILVASGCIEREQLHEYVRRQIEEAVYLLFTWNQGTFTFEPEVHPDAQDVVVSISPESLLLEGARRVDEWSLVEKKIPSFDLVFALDRDHLASASVELSQAQDALLPLIDGRRDVTALVDDSGLDEFEVGKALYGLATAGFLHRVGRSPGPEAVATDTRVQEHRNLGLAFYKTAMYDEAMREFRRVVELRPGDLDAEFHIGLVALRQEHLDEAEKAFRACLARAEGHAAATINLAYVLERAGHVEDARALLAEAERARPGEPTVRLSQGVLALRTGDLAAAERHLQAASLLWASRPKPAAWFHYAGLVAGLRGELDQAIAILEDGIRGHPHHATLHNNLAVALERHGRFEDAAAAIERAGIEDPSVPQVHKNIGDLQYRQGRYDEALEAYLRAVRYDPDLGGDVYLKLGNIRYRRREREGAQRCWERSLALAPDNPMARNNLELSGRLE